MGGGSTPLRLAAVVVLTATTVVVSAPMASAAPLCANDLANHTLTATPQNGGGMTLQAHSGWLSVNDVDCIQLNNVNTVFVDLAPFPASRVTFNLSFGPLAPGFTDEGNGTSEIEFQLLGLGGGSSVRVIGTGGGDGIKLGQFVDHLNQTTVGQINLNALAEPTGQDADVTFQSFPDKVLVEPGLGNDTVAGTGAAALSGIFPRPIEITDTGGGEDHYTGGSGNDLIVDQLQSFVPDAWAGGGGTDTLQLGGGSGLAASITLDGIANDGIDCPGASCAGANAAADFENVTGGPANETIAGTAGPNVLIGGAGSNVLQGLGGNDTLRANQQGIDDFSGGTGRDTVTFMDYSLGFGTTVSLDNKANDGLVGHLTSNVRGDNEIVIGTGSSDVLVGNKRRNTFMGSTGNDTLSGKGGKDKLLPDGHDDTISGGKGFDTLSYANAVLPLTISVGVGQANGDGFDTFDTIEQILGGQGNDLYFGSDGNDVFKAGGGNDTINGSAGNDALYGQAGDDSIDGGIGTDTCDQGPGAGTVVNCEA